MSNMATCDCAFLLNSYLKQKIRENYAING